MTNKNAAGRHIVDLDARAVRATVGVVALAVPDGARRRQPLAPFAPGIPAAAEAGLLDQIVAMLGRSPSWPRCTTELR